MKKLTKTGYNSQCNRIIIIVPILPSKIVGFKRKHGFNKEIWQKLLVERSFLSDSKKMRLDKTTS